MDKRKWRHAKPAEYPNLTPEERREIDHDLPKRIALMTQRRRDEILARIVTKTR